MVLPFLAATELVTELLPVQPDHPPGPLERRYTNETSAFRELRGARVHYRDQGPREAPALVAIHGAYSSLHTWDGWVEHLTDEFRLVRLDLPGFGLTGPREGAHTLRELLLTVAALCDELGLENVSVAGNSVGGGLAWRLAVERPALVDRVLLLNAGGVTLLSKLSNSLTAPVGPPPQRYVTPRIATRLLLLDAYDDSSQVTDSLVCRYHDLMLRRGNRAAVVELAQRYERDHLDNRRHGRSGTRLLPTPATQESDPTPRDGYDPADLSVPALFQWGRKDAWLPASFGRALAARTPDSEFLIYRGTGHMPMEETPGPTATDAAAFLRRTG